MLTFLLILLLFSNALASRRDKSILFSRIVIMSFIFTFFLAYNNLHIKALQKGIGIFGGLFGITIITQSFNISLIIMAVGFLFKVSAAPFHFWSPDVYGGIPTIVTTFVAIIAKISIFIFFWSPDMYDGIPTIITTFVAIIAKISIFIFFWSPIFTIFAITLLLFIYVSQEWFDIVNIISLVFFNYE